MQILIRWVLVVLTCSALVLAHAQKPSSATQSTRKRMASAVEKTSQEGIRGKLPPHISTLLGLSNEQEFPVLQAVVRTADQVQGFDVSASNHDDVIIFIVDQSTNHQALYLTSRDGSLRKVVVVEQGVGQAQKVTAEIRKAFEKERQFWLDRLAPLP